MRQELLTALLVFKQENRMLKRIRIDQADENDQKVMYSDITNISSKLAEMKNVIGYQQETMIELNHKIDHSTDLFKETNAKIDFLLLQNGIKFQPNYDKDIDPS